MSLNRGIAWLEVLVKHMGVLLSSVLESTKKRIENKQTKTFEELEVRPLLSPICCLSVLLLL